MAPSVTAGTTTYLGVDDGPVEVFHGIRYGEPLTGARRFLPPVAADRPGGEVDATVPAPAARQVEGFGVFGSVLAAPVASSPDCLRLTVRRPAMPPAGSDALPVVVWVHGGGNISGSGDLPVFGHHLAAEGCVVVAVNYRLGIDANLVLPAPGGSARGIADIVTALGWVADEIAAFGGDPTRVTLAGHSSGATNALAAWLAVRRAQQRGELAGLAVTRLFLSSGSYLDLLPAPTASAIADRFWSLLGVEERTAEAIVAAGSAADGIEAQMVIESIVVTDPEVYGQVATRPPWQPTLTAPLEEALGADPEGSEPVEVVLALTARESEFFTAAAPDLVTEKFDETFAFLGGEHAGALAARYRALAPGGAPDAVGLVQTHNLFTRPTLALARLLARSGRAVVRLSEWQVQADGAGAAARHGDDLRASLFGRTPATTPAEVAYRDDLLRFVTGEPLEDWPPLDDDPMAGPIRAWTDAGRTVTTDSWVPFADAWKLWNLRWSVA